MQIDFKDAIEKKRRADVIDKTKWILLSLGIPLNSFFIIIDYFYFGWSTSNILLRLGFIPLCLICVFLFRFSFIKRFPFIPVYLAILYVSIEGGHIIARPGHVQTEYIYSFLQTLYCVALIPIHLSEMILSFATEVVVTILFCYANNVPIRELNLPSLTYFSSTVFLIATTVGIHKLRTQFYQKEIELEQEIQNRERIIAEQVDEISKIRVYKVILDTVKGMAHDIRKPFALMRMGLTLFKSDPSEENVKAISHEVEHSMQSAEAMLEDIMDTDNQSAPLREEFPFENCLLNSMQLTFSTTSSDIHLHYQLAPNIWLIGSERKMIRVFANIFANANEALLGRGNIYITAAPINTSTIKISIRNDGPPISPNILKKLFEPYASDSKPTGTGLGLFTSKNIIKRFGGDISCVSLDGVEFQILFPFHMRATEQKINLPKLTSELKFAAGSKNLFLIS